ncbi:hypothetical protein, partial [Methyloceanibacter sp.]|uniref:hypothetical protein n=1 Tax=Methyloceanibacter sp. TaxID=1965321 RepID=UPI003D6D00F9
MPATKTKILRETWEVEPALAALQLDRGKLLNVRTTALGAAADATPFHPANAPGTLSYQYGTFALRYEHVGDAWQADRPNGVEAIKNDAIRVRIVFANVDVACNDEQEPKARSEKGAGAERLCAGNGLFEDLPRYASVDDGKDEGWVTYYLMVAPNGAVELTRATVEG